MIRDTADGLIARGHHPRLVTSHPGRRTHRVEDGLPITRHRRPPERLVRRAGFDEYLTHVPLSYLDLRRGDDDIAHAWFPTDGRAAARWSRRTGCPSVFSYMGMPNERIRIRWDSAPRAVRGSTAITALSRAAATRLKAWLGVEPRVIHPGVDPTRFEPSGPRSASPSIFCPAPIEVGRKRVDLLIAAFRRVRREHPDARLALLRPRDPALAGRLLREEEGLEYVDPLVEPSELAPAYSSAWAMALPSYDEAFGIALIEALACGTPVVGTAIDAFPEIIDRDSVGRLFEDSGEEPLSRALLEALDLAGDPATRDACRARAEEFSTDRSVNAFLELYREVLAR
jgi:glycosyltransferase involved in cell wall biosynthesis